MLLVEKQGIFYNVINQKRQQPDSNSKRKGELSVKESRGQPKTGALKQAIR